MNFSIITPCFNSAKILKRTFQSLLALKRSDFEWILIDDCSSDDGATRKLILWISETAPFPVKTKFLEKNYFGAKSTYEGCLIASGKYACILDHDDELKADALNVVMDNYRYLALANVAGIAGRCVDRNNRQIGKKFPKEIFVGREGVVRFKWRINSELFQFTKVEILRKYFQDFFPGYTNGFVWAKISQDYDFIFVNDVLRVYDTDLPTSYSNTKKLHIVYPEAKARALQQTLDFYNDYLGWNPLYALSIAGSSVRHRLNARIGLLKNPPSKPMARFFYFASIPFGFLKYKNFI